MFFEDPTTKALFMTLDALYKAAFARAAETSFLVCRNSSIRASTLDVTSSALTFIDQESNKYHNMKKKKVGSQVVNELGLRKSL